MLQVNFDPNAQIEQGKRLMKEGRLPKSMIDLFEKTIQALEGKTVEDKVCWFAGEMYSMRLIIQTAIQEVVPEQMLAILEMEKQIIANASTPINPTPGERSNESRVIDEIINS